MVQTNRYLKIGPGGRRCACCFPVKYKDRRKQWRSAKRKAHRAAMREAEVQMEDHWALMQDALDLLNEHDRYLYDYWDDDVDDSYYDPNDDYLDDSYYDPNDDYLDDSYYDPNDDYLDDSYYDPNDDYLDDPYYYHDDYRSKTLESMKLLQARTILRKLGFYDLADACNDVAKRLD